MRSLIVLLRPLCRLSVTMAMLPLVLTLRLRAVLVSDEGPRDDQIARK